VRHASLPRAAKAPHPTPSPASDGGVRGRRGAGAEAGGGGQRAASKKEKKRNHPTRSFPFLFLPSPSQT